MIAHRCHRYLGIDIIKITLSCNYIIFIKGTPIPALYLEKTVSVSKGPLIFASNMSLNQQHDQPISLHHDHPGSINYEYNITALLFIDALQHSLLCPPIPVLMLAYWPCWQSTCLRGIDCHRSTIVTPFHGGLWAHNPNLVKIHIALTWKLMIQSGHNFAHVMTAELSWHVQICNQIGSLGLKVRTKIISERFESWAHKVFMRLSLYSTGNWGGRLRVRIRHWSRDKTWIV